jgi:hypothetical protein
MVSCYVMPRMLWFFPEWKSHLYSPIHLYHIRTRIKNYSQQPLLDVRVTKMLAPHPERKLLKTEWEDYPIVTFMFTL